MICLKKANPEDLEKEWLFVREMPEDENGLTNAWHGVSREDFENEALPSMLKFAEGRELPEGYVPENDVWLSSSCTEEWAGDGCPKLVEELKKRGVRPFLVCDEGGGIITDPVGGIRGNFAMVGVFEKGKADVRFTARSEGGHASAPLPIPF